MRLRLVKSAAAVTFASSAGTGVALLQGTLTAPHAVADTGYNCPVSWVNEVKLTDGDYSFASPWIEWTLEKGGNFSGTMKSAVKGTCDTDVLTIAGNNLWKEVGSKWVEQDPTSGFTYAFGSTEAEADDDQACGNTYDCTETHWKQNWSTTMVVQEPEYWSRWSASCAAETSLSLYCSGTRFGPQA